MICTHGGLIRILTVFKYGTPVICSQTMNAKISTIRSRMGASGVARLAVLLGILFLFSCQGAVQKRIVIATGPPGTSNFEIGNIVASVLADNRHFKIDLETKAEGSLARVDALLKGRADFALIQNDLNLPDSASFRLRAVLPLYPQVLFIVYDSTIQAKNLPELMEGKRIGVGPKNSGVHAFIKILLHEFHVDTSTCRFVFSSYDNNVIGDSIDVACSLTGFNNLHIQRQIEQKHGKIWGFDPLDRLGRGASADGFCMKYPYAIPYVIPVDLYRNYPHEPLLTLAISNILIAKSDIDDIVVYDVVKQLTENREMLMNRSVLFSGTPALEHSMVTTRIPVHEGTRMYLNRDRPSFYERYAEVFGLVITIITVIASALFGLVQLRNLRSDRRREKYYMQLFDLQRRLEFTYDLPTLMELEQELRILWKAFLSTTEKRKIRIDRDFHALRQDLKETEDELYQKKAAAE